MTQQKKNAHKKGLTRLGKSVNFYTRDETEIQSESMAASQKSDGARRDLDEHKGGKEKEHPYTSSTGLALEAGIAGTTR